MPQCLLFGDASFYYIEQLEQDIVMLQRRTSGCNSADAALDAAFCCILFCGVRWGPGLRCVKEYPYLIHWRWGPEEYQSNSTT